jgi:exopolysaccharide biosynthesis protein
MVIHIVTVELTTPGLGFLVTPPDETGRNVENPLRARTTSQFLEEFHVQLAVNGDGFHPWYSNSLVDYYPHEGDPVTPNGYAASRGKPYSDGSEPTLFINQNNVVSFNDPKGKVFNALSGDRMLVVEGEPVEGLDDRDADPRTAIGLDRSGKSLILIVVDGRQPFYSQGATFVELAQILINYGAYAAMNLDGGGSSTLVRQGGDGRAVILNSPINSHVPRQERPVGNHLGIFISQ